MRVSLDFFGDDLIASEIVGMGDRARDLRPAYRKIVHQLNDVAERQFDTQGNYASGGWAPLAPATLRRKAQAGLDPRILHRSHRLRDSLMGRNADRVQRVNRKSLVWGTYTRYAKYHQTGTVTMPRRRLMELKPNDRRLIVRTIYQRVMEEQGLA